MRIDISQRNGLTVLSLVGQVDLSSSPQARQAILASLERGKGVQVDLSAVEYIDSSGLASLIEGYQKARRLQLDFALVNVSAVALKVLQLARLDRVFPIEYDTAVVSS